MKINIFDIFTFIFRYINPFVILIFFPHFLDYLDLASSFNSRLLIMLVLLFINEIILFLYKNHKSKNKFALELFRPIIIFLLFAIFYFIIY